MTKHKQDKAIHIYKANGEYYTEEGGSKPTLEKMQGIVGGYIEPLTVKHEGHMRVMVVNEEGLMRELPFNRNASRIAGRTIVGDVLILQGWRL